ncbi:MAG TPA: serine/threonine-protein kinase [Polyangiaceae bacterium]|nr:serine/threonine-protein kinase [Polyangiaceae bacterium]
MVEPHSGWAMTFAQQRVIGRYLLGDAIAAGGMATVHFGRLLGPAGFSRTVAIKQLRPGLPSDTESLTTFLDEARLASRIHHPNVVSPIDVVLIANEAFIVMEYVHGESLSRLLKAAPGVPVRPTLAAAVIGQVLFGLHAAHRAVSEDGVPLELVHRDVSPQNILITPEGIARILDFGIAKAARQSHHTMNGVLKGKLAYMAPEQVTSSPVSSRTDIFAAGTVLWEMLTGQRLFLAETPAACVQKILHDPIPAPSALVDDVPRELDEVVLRALARDPEERFPDAQTMALAVAAAVRSASSLEVGAWVTELCGDSLLERGDRIADFEAMPLEELTLGLPAASFGTPVPTGFTMANALLPPPAADALSSSRAARFRRRAAVFGAAVLTFGTLSVAGPRAMQRFSQAGKSKVARTALANEPTPANEPTLAVASSESGSPHARRFVDSGSSSSTVAPSESPRPEGSRRSAVQTRLRPSVAAVGPSRSVDAPHTELARATPAVPNKLVSPKPVVSAKRSPNCDIPYTIDERGVKRFNPDCL